MPAYYDYTVPVPAVKNISRKKINGSVYIYYTYGREMSENGNIAPKNQSIGKLKPGTNPPEMYPNINYYEYFDKNGPAADATKATGEKPNFEPGLPSGAPASRSAGSGLTKAEIEIKVNRLITGLSLVRDSFRDLAQEMQDSGGDVAELEKQISSLFEPGWIFSVE